MKWINDDGGRSSAGYKGQTGDCVTRAIAIASKRPYAEIYDALADGTGNERKSKGRTARNGIHVRRKWFKEYMEQIGFKWTPTMGIGTGCRVHLHDGELPMGRLVVAVSKHYTAVIDGVIHDTHDPQRETHLLKSGPDGVSIPNGIARRCVYGYWTFLGEIP